MVILHVDVCVYVLCIQRRQQKGDHHVRFKLGTTKRASPSVPQIKCRDSMSSEFTERRLPGRRFTISTLPCWIAPESQGLVPNPEPLPLGVSSAAAPLPLAAGGGSCCWVYGAAAMLGGAARWPLVRREVCGKVEEPRERREPDEERPAVEDDGGWDPRRDVDECGGGRFGGAIEEE